MAQLSALLPDPVMRARLRDAVALARRGPADHGVTFCEDWASLRSAVAQSPPQLMVVDPYASGRMDVEACRALQLRAPAVPVFAYATFDSPRDVLRLSQLGIAGMAARDVDDDPAELHRLLSEALSRAPLERLVEACAEQLTPELERWLRALWDRAHESVSPAAAARLYHRHAKTLGEHLRGVGLPSVNRIVVWVRLLYAASLLQGGSRHVERVALHLGFPSANAFRNQLHRYAGTSPRDVCARGGFDFLLGEFTRRCGTRRTAA